MPTVAAVVSLYNPDGGVLANAATLLGQADSVIVVDDGSPADPTAVLTDLSELGCAVMRLEQNSGIAAALNAGIISALAQKPKPDYVLTMDQDSLLADGYILALTNTASAASAAGVTVGMVGPGSVLGLPVRRAGNKDGVEFGGEPIQSGLLIPVPVLERIGLFQESLFIDGVDSEFFLRCARAGLKAVIASDAELQHSLGSPTAATVFGRSSPCAVSR
ncbi:glycosyltransferase [Arthrobacter ulcerisalmonis]|uniref:glycosyltransferase n=1 Tax=Arthrobacter ulcerisalmonis TaxID=2483813 RepID=UPI0036297F4B